jgi:hypothetical protein
VSTIKKQALKHGDLLAIRDDLNRQKVDAEKNLYAVLGALQLVNNLLTVVEAQPEQPVEASQ